MEQSSQPNNAMPAAGFGSPQSRLRNLASTIRTRSREFAEVIDADQDVSPSELLDVLNEAAIGADEIAAQIEQRLPVAVGIYVEGGLVQGVRASEKVDVFAADMDVFDGSRSHAEACPTDESADERQDHDELRADVARYDALPEEAY